MKFHSTFRRKARSLYTFVRQEKSCKRVPLRINKAFTKKKPKVVLLQAEKNAYFKDLFKNSDHIKRIKECLAEIGYQAYLNDKVTGGNINANVINERLTSIAKLLSWSYCFVNHARFEESTASVINWTRKVFLQDAPIFAEYQDYIRNVKKNSPLTVASNLYHFKNYMKWCFHFSQVFRKQISRRGFDRLNIICDSIINGCKKVAKKTISKDHNVDAMINALRFPPGGLKQLQEAIEEEIDWVNSFKATDKYFITSTMDESVYKKFIGLLIASIYCFAPQGRIAALESMEMKDADRLLSSYVMSTVLKTQSKYGYQPVYLCPIAKNILEVYLNHMRPIVCKHRKAKPTDPLFITYAGAPHKLLGQAMASFFVPKDLWITPTTVRKLMEMEAHKRYVNGELSLAEKQAVEDVNGHSSATVKDYYQYTSMSDQLNLAVKALNFSNLNEDYFIPAPNPLLKDWGTEHPCYGSDSKRVEFSKEELRYIVRALQSLLTDTNDLPINCTSLVLKQIREDPDATPIFHKRHILKSDRLRAGIRSAFKLRQKVCRYIYLLFIFHHNTKS